MSSTTEGTRSEGAVEQAKSELGDAAATAQQKAVELKEQGKGKLAETLDRRTTDAGNGARSAADAMRKTSTQMRMQGDSTGRQVAGFMEAAADRVEELGGYLERTSGDRLLRDAEDFARRRPWMVAGFGLLAGLAASRFLKASSERRYDSRHPATQTRYPYGSPAVSAYPYTSPAGMPAGGRTGDAYAPEVT